MKTAVLPITRIVHIVREFSTEHLQVRLIVRFCKLSGIACCLLLVGTCTAGLAQGKGNGVEVRAISGTLVESQPGGIVSVSFQVTNNSGNNQEFVEALDLPQGWQPITPVASFGESPDERQVRIVAFLVPIGARAGEYEVAYSVRGYRDYGVRDRASVKVVVLPVSKIDLLVDQKPGTVIAGDQYSVNLRVVNRGNKEVRLRITARNNEGYPAHIEPAVVELGAGRSAIVIVKVDTDSKVNRSVNQFLQISATPEGEKTAVANASVLVNIIGKVSSRSDVYQNLNTNLHLRAVNDGGKTSFQAAFSGLGGLNIDNSRRIDFLLRGPDISNNSYYAERDEYRLNYYSPKYDIFLGDQAYSLSKLTDYYRYGRGMGAEVRGNHGEAGAFFSKAGGTGRINGTRDYT